MNTQPAKRVYYSRMLAFLLCLCLCLGLYSPAVAAGATGAITGLNLDSVNYGLMGVQLQSSSLGESAVAFKLNDIAIPGAIDNNATQGFIFVVDRSKPYFNQNQSTYPTIVKTTINSMLDTFNAAYTGNAQYAFVWVDSAVSVTSFMDITGARQQVDDSFVTILTKNYNEGLDASFLYDGLGAAINLSLGDKAPTYSQIIVFSDGVSTSSSYSPDSIQAWLNTYPSIIHAVTYWHSNVQGDRVATSSNARSQLQTLTTNNNGCYTTFDIHSYRNKTAYADAVSRDMVYFISQVTASLASLHEYQLDLNYLTADDYQRIAPVAQSALTLLNPDGSVISRHVGDLGMAAIPTPRPTPSPTPVPVVQPVAKYGDSNNASVSQLQTFLLDNNYPFAGSVTGTFDTVTKEAYQFLCEYNGRPLESYDAIYEDFLGLMNVAFKPYATPVPTATATPTPTPRPLYMDIRTGEQNDYVKQLQNHLSQLGYFHQLSVTVGVYDEATQLAQNRFCEQNNYVVQTGCSASLLETILSSKVTYEKPLYMQVEYGGVDRSSDTYIRNIQQRLCDLGYLTVTYKTGTMDDATQSALNDFCANNGLPIESGASIDLQSSLFSLTARPKLTAEDLATPTPRPEFVDLERNDGSFNDKQDYVSKLQNQLFALGYMDGTFNDGEYDETTQNAVNLFLTQHGLNSIDGGSKISSSIQQSYLFSSQAQVRFVPEPSLSEKLIMFAMSTISIANFAVPMWAIIALCILLLFAFILILIIAHSRSKHAEKEVKQDTASETHRPARQLHMAPESPTISYDQPTAGSTIVPAMDMSGGDQPTASGTAGMGMGGMNGMNMSGDAPTMADLGGDSPTVGDFSSYYSPAPATPSVTLDISYGGMSHSNTYQLTGKLTIGRKSDCEVQLDTRDMTASRHHCELYFSGSQLYVKNLSSSEAGTILNGMRVGESTQSMNSGDDAPTVGIFSAGSGEEGAPVNNGDTLTVGQHTILIHY